MVDIINALDNTGEDKRGPSAPIRPPTTASDREAMGLPPHYVEYKFPDHLKLSEGWVHATSSLLLSAIEDEAFPLDERIGAATRLSFIGDPRINSCRPTMVQINSYDVSIGLETDRLDSTVTDLATLFVQRDWILKECPRHDVPLAPYSIARYPVTNKEYLEFLQQTLYPELPSSWDFGRYPEHRATHPVYTVSIDAARAYTVWLSTLTGRKFRLPTEAEWEHAAAGPKGYEYPWGDEFALGHANTIEEGLGVTTPVGVFPLGRSWFGVDDLAGNVEEYVADPYAPYPGGVTVTDDLSNAWEGRPYHVARGGSFTRFRDLARTRRRHGLYPRPIYAIGFRLAEDG